MNKAKLPTSKAKTAYGLLSDVRRVILEEPKRYNQLIWLERVDPSDAVGSDRLPACGTVGCVAAWTAILGSKDGKSKCVRIDAESILDLSSRQAYELFCADAVCPSLRVGTKQYAQSGARHIHNFQRKHAKQLKATKVSR